MSEFSSTNIFRSASTSSVREDLSKAGAEFILRELSGEWSALFLKDEWLQSRKTIELLNSISVITPILHFEHAEDHGWAFRLFNCGQQVAMASVDYQLEYGMAMKLLQSRHLNQEDLTDFLYFTEEGREAYNSTIAEVRSSQLYRQAIAGNLAAKNCAEFACFGLDQSVVSALEQELSLENPGYKDSHGPSPERFQSLLGFPEFAWMSYSY